MSSKSLGNPFDGDISLSHKKDCGCETCNAAHKGVDLTSEKQSRMLFEKQAHNSIQKQCMQCQVLAMISLQIWHFGVLFC